MSQNKGKRKNFQKQSQPDRKKFDDKKAYTKENHSKNSKIFFDDEGNVDKKKNSKKLNLQAENIGSRWYEEFAKYNTNEELLEMKETEVTELSNMCKTCFENELSHSQKKNPNDAKWLEIALHKGTSKDRANAGALLVQSNPLGNISSLEKLIGLTKISNKTSTEAIGIITELFMSALLSPNRKLLSIPLRGADWKSLKKDTDLEKSEKDRVLASWHFEAELKEQYFDFLRNLQAAIQGNQDSSKNLSIVCASKLLCYSPEKEQMLLSMLVNKLGDPSKKVASKALHHLSEVAYKHPAMCEVIAKETEKLLFRNNITEHAQHFALCFLAQIAPRGNVQLCTKLVEICFSFFKVMVQKGAVNSKTMQAILRCLKRAIIDATSESSDADSILTKDIKDTMYRLVHLADIHIALQTFALLLQIMTVKTGKYDRFYNALYKKMLDMELVNVGPKAAAQFLHIIHRSIYMDANVARAQAFIKRLLQISFYFPVQIACGSLIVIDKLLKSRPELGKVTEATETEKSSETKLSENEDESDDDEHYKDVEEDGEQTEKSTETPIATVEEKAQTSWHHAKNLPTNQTEKVSQIAATKYNPYHRTPSFAGAEFVHKIELLQLVNHFHPTLKVFAQNIIDLKPINFYGDPLRDFCLTQFLDRFAFRNPKKQPAADKSDLNVQHNKKYTARGGRGLPVNELTKSNCTEDEKFILEYLQQKREKRAAFDKNDEDDEDEDDGDEDTESVGDDEFDAYLDGLGGKDDDLDFMNDLGDELNDDKTTGLKKKKKRKDVDEDVEENDWNDGELDEDGDKEIKQSDDEEQESDDDGSISLSDDSEDDASVFDGDEDDDEDIFEEDSDADDDDDDEPKSKKMKPMSGKDFQKTLKNTDNMQSLFAAADDFAEMLEETGKSKTHGTLGDIFNKDKASEKQLNWEQKRSKSHDYSSKKNFKQKFGNKKKSGNKKRF